MEQPAPDTKNWTWVLDRACPECGLDLSSISQDQVPALMRANAAGFREALGRGAIVHERPPVAPGASVKWSALEYGAHVRDVYAMAKERISGMMRKKAPTFADWDQNAAAIDGDYRNQDPDKIAYALAATAGKTADLLDKVRGDKWQRVGVRSDGAEFTIASLALYLYHDVHHHLWDVEQGFAAIIEARKAAKKG